MKHKALFIIAGLFIIALPLFAQKADTLQPGPEGKDAFISEITPDQNYGNSVDLWIGKAGTRFVYYSFIEFDLSSYSGKILDSCFLDLYCENLKKTAGCTDTTGIFEVGESWDEASITWNNKPLVGSVVSFYIGTDSLTWWIWDVKGLVQEWLDGTKTNYGFCVDFLSGGGADSYAKFWSSDLGTCNPRPKLRLYFKDQKSITVISPNGGEDWQVGSTQEIKWSWTGQIDSVIIQYINESTKGWPSQYDSIAIIPNTGSYSWTIPNTPGDSTLVTVADVSAYVWDNSNNFFTISAKPPAKSITVISPNGGEKWKVGEQREIKWSSTGAIPKVNISYTPKWSDGQWYDIATNYDNTGSYSWTIPNTPGDEALVDINDAADPIFDVSDDFFTISPASSLVEHQNREAGRLWLGVHTSPSTQPIIRYQIPVPSKTSLKIYTIDGRIVRDLTSQVTANSGNLVWDGCDDSNKPVPTGIYFCQLKTKNKQATRKIMVVR